MSSLTEHDLRRFRAGDEAMFRRVVHEYSPRLLAFVRPFAADLDDAHDLLQEMWHRAYEKRQSFVGSGTLLGWLYAVSRTVCLTVVERRVSRDRLGGAAAQTAAMIQQDPHLVAEHSALRESINRAVMELPERERDIVVLRMLYQRSTRETAEALGCAEGTVKAALHHALKKLQNSMEAWVQ